MSPSASPGDSLVRPPAAPPPDQPRRLARLLLVRTLVVTVVLVLSLWLAAESDQSSRGAVWMQTSIIVATYVSSIVFGVLLRRGLPPQRVARPMLANDLLLTSALVYVTGGALSPYTFLYALTIVTAGAVAFRRGAAIVTASALGSLVAISLLAWTHAIAVPLPRNVEPWVQSGRELARTLGVQGVLMVGVGGLAVIFGDQIQRGAETLATTRRAAAELLSLHQDIVRSLSSGLVTLNHHGLVQTANDAASEILGLDVDQLVGLPIDSVLPGLGALVGAAEGGELRRADLVVPSRGRELVIGATVSPLRDVHDQVIGRVVNFQDLTELKRLEQHARRGERLAMIGQLAAAVAHEIRNPLASISGSIELLTQSPQTTDDDKTLMSIVHREVDRLNILIGDLLDYANPRPKQPVDFDLGELVEEVLQVARTDRAFAEVELATELERPIPIQADPAKLRQVLWNLVRNAAEAARAGGKHVRVIARPDGGGARVSVEDDGPGIAPEALAHIFDPFFTTKPKGTGLGLATTHSVVAEHGGRIDVDTTPGKGTKMVVLLPAPS